MVLDPGLALVLIKPGLKILLVQIFVILVLSSARASGMITIAVAVPVLMLVLILVAVACFIAIACRRTRTIHSAVTWTESNTAVATATTPVATTPARFNDTGSCSDCDRQQDACECGFELCIHIEMPLISGICS